MLAARLAKAGLALQTAKGSPAANPTYGFGVQSGAVFTVSMTENEIPTTWTTRDIQGYDRTQNFPSQVLVCSGYPDLIGLMLMGVLGNDVVTGAAGAWVHTFTPAVDLPYATGFGMFAGADYIQMADAKIDQLEIAWDSSGAIVVTATILGCAYTFLAAAYAEETSDIVSGALGYLIAAGGTFTLQGNDVHCESGSITIANGITQVPVAENPYPADVVEGKQTITWSQKVHPDDMTLVRSVLTGDPAGTTPGPSPFIGAMHASFVAPNGAGLSFDSAGVRYGISYPEVAVDGGPVEITAEGEAVLTAAANPTITAVLNNAVTSYAGAG